MIIVIPAYQPDEKLLRLLRELKEQTGYTVVVVNDGSAAHCAPVFEEAETLATVLHHEVNRGKGAAMKTAFAYIAENFDAAEGIVTADADGQHLVSDIIRVARAQAESPEDLIMGTRRFTGDVPWKSRAGNSITRFVFAISTGVRVYDTQTGLRAFSVARAREMCALKGDRYDYEINQLLHCTRNHIHIAEVTIETVYIGENESSHFHVWRDSFRIYKILLSYVATSVFCFLFEYFMTLGLNVLLGLPFLAGVRAFSLSIARALHADFTLPTLIARISSATLNYNLNKKAVFHSKNKTSALRYTLVAVVVYGLYWGLLYIARYMLGWQQLWLIMLPAQLITYPVNFWLQRKFVFAKSRTK
ncbi:MAG: bifunctional glycosyltransferase family 2/GtrA family protein [Clostridiales bacterium]|nr:bifunctional glycosyltransferase family 2/GtrA family protein [Clostridiales bacterium]